MRIAPAMKELCGTVLVNNTTRELRYAAVGPLAPYVPQVWRQGALSTNFDQVCIEKYVWMHIAPSHEGIDQSA